jgi:hypothetical protein
MAQKGGQRAFPISVAVDASRRKRTFALSAARMAARRRVWVISPQPALRRSSNCVTAGPLHAPRRDDPYARSRTQEMREFDPLPTARFRIVRPAVDMAPTLPLPRGAAVVADAGGIAAINRSASSVGAPYFARLRNLASSSASLIGRAIVPRDWGDMLDASSSHSNVHRPPRSRDRRR